MDPWTEPPVLPSLTLPEAPLMPPPVLEVPRAELPRYKPLVVPPNTLRPPPGIDGINTEDEPPKEKAKPVQPTKPALPEEAQIVEIPFTDIELSLIHI